MEGIKTDLEFDHGVHTHLVSPGLPHWLDPNHLCFEVYPRQHKPVLPRLNLIYNELEE